MARLKVALVSTPILRLPEVSRPFRVKVDACKVRHGLGAILLQQALETSIWHPVAYWNKSLTDTERRYSATELECKGLHDAIMHW